MNDILKNKQLWAFASSKKKPTAGAKIKTEKKFGLKAGNLILCRNCGNTITTPEHIIAVNEEHIHTFTSPEEIIYHIGCFSSADGCVTYGDPSPKFTWFEGFSWNFSICSKCLIHLGWYYQRGKESFFSLIVDRLMDTTQTHWTFYSLLQYLLEGFDIHLLWVSNPHPGYFRKLFK